jgi:hypothetical protein
LLPLGRKAKRNVLEGEPQMVEAAKKAYVYDVLPRETISGMTGRQVLDAIVDGRLPQAPISQVLNFG